MHLDLTGLCSARSASVENLGVLLTNRTLWRVCATVFGTVSFDLLFISDVADVARRGVLKGGTLETLQRRSALYRECTDVILSRLLGASGYTTSGTSEVNTAPFEFGGLATSRRRPLVVVIRNVYPIRLRLIILSTLFNLSKVGALLIAYEIAVWLMLSAHDVWFFVSLTSLFIRWM